MDGHAAANEVRRELARLRNILREAPAIVLADAQVESESRATGHGRWVHRGPPDPNIFNCGRLEANKIEDLAAWVDVDIKTLSNLDRAEVVWVFKECRGRWVIWFKTPQDYEHAFGGRKEAETGKPVEKGQERTKGDERGKRATKRAIKRPTCE
jgi:hypothetical protein